MTHVWWHRAYCQLFRGTICNTSHILPESYNDILGPKAIREGRKKCVHHAQSICTIFASLLALEGDTWTLEYDMAECAYTTAEILLSIDIALQSEIGLTGEQVQGCAAVCLQLMKRLQQMYPYVSTLIADIELALQNSQNVPFETAISKMIEISPHQYVPRYSIVGQTCSTNDNNVLGASTQSTASRLPDSDSSLLRSDIDTMMCIDAYSLLQKTRSPNSQYWVTDNDPGFPEFESISNIWGEITFSDPHI
ncbi:hypothetical protein N7456_006467 [Penicillium angulare]|uniref:Uncharacterized protein n=1 Tax=Penicillium angulare TaxID=116970 RepID=A0A9W9FHQ1_9EURO|nr:hypothetical protein N7456_006467 [Penicillium angulare]